MTPKLYDFYGGMHLQDHKTESVIRGLQQASLPAQLYLPLKQHIGAHNKALVDVGSRVVKGQIIAASASPICAPVHAPSSGVVSAIDRYPVAHPSGQSDTCIVIDTDGKDQPDPAQGLNLADSSPAEMMDFICQAGVVGLGGAAFPTTAKLSRANTQAVDTLIINGVECEPYITCDDMLMRVYATGIIRGVGYLQRILPIKNTLIGIEDNKPEAIVAMRQALLDCWKILKLSTSRPNIRRWRKAVNPDPDRQGSSPIRARLRHRYIVSKCRHLRRHHARTRTGRASYITRGYHIRRQHPLSGKLGGTPWHPHQPFNRTCRWLPGRQQAPGHGWADDGLFAIKRAGADRQGEQQYPGHAGTDYPPDSGIS